MLQDVIRELEKTEVVERRNKGGGGAQQCKVAKSIKNRWDGRRGKWKGDG